MVEKYVNDPATLGEVAYDVTIGSTLDFLEKNFGVTDYSNLQSQYNYKGYSFPSDLTADSGYNTHYMMINISINKLLGGSVTLPGEKILAGESTTQANVNKQISQGILGGGYSIYQRVDTTLVLYMPNTVLFTQANQYEDVSLTNILGKALSLSSSLKRVATGLLDSTETLAQMAGASINPKTEVLFTNTSQRQFQFEFLFAPESEEEVQSLKNIIKALRFHTAPEAGAVEGYAKGSYWVEPSNFDITFWNKGRENTNIPKINTCVMEALDVDYAPTGIYSTFSNGYPVSVRLTMRLRERNIIHKELVNMGF